MTGQENHYQEPAFHTNHQGTSKAQDQAKLLVRDTRAIHP